MININDDSVQAVQAILGRTHKGRVIRHEAMDAAKAWSENRSSDYGNTECSVCGIVLKSNYFIHSCPNCGSTDVKSVSS